MTFENEVYQSFSDVPELPTDVFFTIERVLHKRAMIRTRLFALAASIVVLVATVPFILNHYSAGGPLRPEVTSELLTVQKFLNGDDLESDSELYAVVEGY